MRSAHAKHWALNPDLVYLNHGSFGACPKSVLDAQTKLREHMEWHPEQFFLRELEDMLDSARAKLALFLRVDPEDLAFVTNATTGVNAVLRSLRFERDDELLTTNHTYNACRNTLEYVAQLYGARVVVVDVPFPLASSEQVTEAVLRAVGKRTKLALLDHVTSPTGLIFPLGTLVAALRERGVDTLIDGAHAPVMLDLDLTALGATYYTGNCHKWMCAPKGAAFLHVSREKRDLIRPTVISHGANATRSDRSRFREEFDYVGTDDPSSFLAIPIALDALSKMMPDGIAGVRHHNHELALKARAVLMDALELDKAPAPDDMIGSLVALPLPDSEGDAPTSYLHHDPLRTQLFEKYRIEVPTPAWPRHPKRLIRVSAQLYNDISDYELLASALRALL